MILVERHVPSGLPPGRAFGPEAVFTCPSDQAIAAIGASVAFREAPDAHSLDAVGTLAEPCFFGREGHTFVEKNTLSNETFDMRVLLVRLGIHMHLSDLKLLPADLNAHGPNKHQRRRNAVKMPKGCVYMSTLTH